MVTELQTGGLVTSPMSDLVFHRALRARRAAFSNVLSPVSRLSVANSRMKVPTPAVHVTGVSVGLTPFRRFTVPYGMPVAVWNAAVIHNTCHSFRLMYSSVMIQTLRCQNVLLCDKNNPKIFNLQDES